MKLMCSYIKGILLMGFLFLFWNCKYDSEGCFLSLEQQYIKQIDSCVFYCQKIDSSKSKSELITLFKSAKERFKRNEALMGFFSSSLYQSLNRPNLPIVDQDDNAEKVISPSGFQVFEEVLCEDPINYDALIRHRENIINSLKLEKANFSFKKAKDYQLIWAIRDCYLRIASLGISGFDSPLLENSTQEVKESLNGIKQIFELFRVRFKDSSLYYENNTLLEYSMNYLRGKDYESFDRYMFLKSYLNPLVKLLNKISIDWAVQYPFDRKLSNYSDSFFSVETFNNHLFSSKPQKPSWQVISLGEKMFYDPKLSKNKLISCSSCHQPQNAFTDAMVRPKSLISNSLKRNTPTLLYSGFQSAQFYDARSLSIENQIVEVVKEADEFHTDLESIVAYLSQDASYRVLFQKAFNQKANTNNFRFAIASYVRSLAPFKSKFDLSMSTQELNLTEKEIEGFNLFMGKAKCGTCHFLPVFNGTIPPYYNESELESIGVPEKVEWSNAVLDGDLGRYHLHKVEEKKYFFKTPTLRNIEKTAPYMHNGVYSNLEDVIKFYNLGGAQGIGIPLASQTLPNEELNLSEKQVDNLIAFLKSLNDPIDELFVSYH